MPFAPHVCRAGARGIEPLVAGLESTVLPLHQAPEEDNNEQPLQVRSPRENAGRKR